MSIKENFINEFIKGLGKTTGVVTVLSFVGCAYYV